VKTLFLEATFLNRGGRRQEALARSGEVLEQSRAKGLPENHTQMVYHAILLVGMGRPEAALPILDDASRAFAAQQMKFDQLQVEIWAADALVEMGDARAARERLDRSWPAIEAQIAARNAAMTKGLRVRATILAAEGRAEEARSAVEQAVAIIVDSGSPTYTGAGPVFRTAAEMALACGDPAAALERAGRALDAVARNAIDPTGSADIGEVLLTRARIAAATGHPDDAHRDASDALRHFQATLPTDHPLARSARALLDPAA